MVNGSSKWAEQLCNTTGKKNMKKLFLATTLMTAAALPQLASAAPVDLTGWIAEGQGNWSVQSGGDTVFQSTNGQPTVFFEDGSNARGTQLSGEITVQTTRDDDFIGFVLGYQSGELSAATTDFWLIDWKQRDQNPAVDGLALSQVTSASNANNFTDFWTHSGGVNEIARGTNLGSTGWADNTTYKFDLVFTSQLIEVFVDGLKEISVTAAQAGVSEFNDGAMGFYNYSQSSVLYSSITKEVASVSEPATFALMGFGLLGVGLTRRKKSA